MNYFIIRQILLCWFNRVVCRDVMCLNPPYASMLHFRQPCKSSSTSGSRSLWFRSERLFELICD